MPGVVVAVIALVATLNSASSASAPTLTPMSAKQLLVAVQQSRVQAFSGTVVERTDLGLPELPGTGSTASLSWQDFLTGTHSFRVWADGPQKQRAALIGQLSEADVVHNGKDVWTYTSSTNTVSHHVLTTADHRRPVGTAPDLTPSAAAQRALDAITPSTKVTVDTAQKVAGRDAYTLDVAPRDSRSTVRRIAIAIDAQKFVPLRVQVFGSSSSPAFSLGFSDVSFSRPAASTFTFRPPAGASVESNPVTTPTRHDVRHGTTARPQQPSVVGTGWTAVLELHGAQGLGGRTLQEATTPAAHGARLLKTALVNALFLPDGRVFAGAVTPAALQQIAATAR